MHRARSQTLLVKPLAPPEIGALYPIVRTVEPRLTLQQWQRYAARIGRGRGRGVLVAHRSGAPFPCGALCYRMQHAIGADKLVEIEHLAAADLLDPDPVLAALLASLETLARENGCGAIRTALPNLPPALIRAFGGAGHQLCGVVLGKTLGATPGCAAPPPARTCGPEQSSPPRDRQVSHA